MTQDLSSIAEQIAASPSEHGIWVAYSGGVDSHVLLHLLASSGLIELSRLHAIHIDHGLDIDSQRWASHCQKIADDLRVDFYCVSVVVDNIALLGLEAAARQARYQAIAEAVPKGDIVLTAQHQEDQAETLLLQLLRGSGVKGLSAMAAEFSLIETAVFRPLLQCSQSTILRYAQQHELIWVDDPSNNNTQLNRNYLRHQIWPLLTERWPSAAKSLSRSASFCAESDSLLSELAAMDVSALSVDWSAQCLSISALLKLSGARARNVIRYVLSELKMIMPSAVVLQRILDELCLASEDKMPIVAWGNSEARRYQDSLYFLCPQRQQDINESHLCLKAENVVLLDGRQVTWVEADDFGVNEDLFTQSLRIGFRQGGEVIQLAGHAHHKSLKQLYQEWSIPPWERNRIPLLFHGNELLAVVGYGFSEKCILLQGAKGYAPVMKL